MTPPTTPAEPDAPTKAAPKSARKNAPDPDAAPAPSSTARPKPGERKPRLSGDERTVIVVSAIVVLFVGCALAVYFRVGRSPATAALQGPRVDDGIPAIAAFVASPQFPKLPFERQRLYMELLDARSAELDKAYAESKIPASAYRRAIEYAWFGKQLPRMDKYLSLPPDQQDAYIEQRLDKKDGKGRKKPGGGGGGDTKGIGTGNSEATLAVARTDASIASIDITRDEQSEKDIPKTWPEEWRRKWKEYRGALKDRKLEREEEAEEAAATRPAS
jgi:hypothetical protein